LLDTLPDLDDHRFEDGCRTMDVGSWHPPAPWAGKLRWAAGNPAQRLSRLTQVLFAKGLRPPRMDAVRTKAIKMDCSRS
jgi:hypothetical protein